MNIFQQLFQRPSKDVLHTEFGDFNLAAKTDQKRLQAIVIDLYRRTDALTRKDIADWRNAWALAINYDHPNRQRLYDIYNDVDVDLHLTGCITQRTGFALSRSFKLVKDDGTEVPEATELLNASWFKDLLQYALLSVYWGYQLIELGDVIMYDGRMTYSDVHLIPRKHVIPEYHRIIPNLGMDWTSGIDYTRSPYTEWLIQVGHPGDLGLYLKAATQTIPKKNAMSFWDTFAEIFGMPMRIAKTSSRTNEDIQRVADTMKNMGAALYGVFPDGTDIQVVESTKGDAFNVYDQRINRANTELSKLVIGQTMTIENGSSLSQSETHLKVFDNIVESDRDLLRDVVNNQLLPRMVRHGFPVGGLRFDWDYSADYTPEQQVAFETLILNNYEVDPKYFEEKYGLPVGQRRSAASPQLSATLFEPTHPTTQSSPTAPSDPTAPSSPSSPTPPASPEPPFFV